MVIIRRAYSLETLDNTDTGGYSFRLAARGVVNDRLPLVLMAAVSASLAACSAAPSQSDNAPLPQIGDYKVTAEVVDSRTKKPVPTRKELAKQPPSPEILDTALQAEPPMIKPLTPDALPEPKAPPKPAHVPQRSPDEEFLLRVARERPLIPLEGSINGEAVVANFAWGDEHCGSVAVTSPARRFSEIWRACATGPITLQRPAEPLPAVPEDPELAALHQMTVNEAFTEGRASAPYGELRITAQAMTPQDAKGCSLVRSALTWRGVVLDMKDTAVCLQAE